jgi:hypothetical protein
MIYDYILGVLIYGACFAVITFTVWVTSSGWPLLAFLLVPRLVVVKDGKEGFTGRYKEAKQ